MKLKLCGPQLNAISTWGTTERGPGDLSRFMGTSSNMVLSSVQGLLLVNNG